MKLFVLNDAGVLSEMIATDPTAQADLLARTWDQDNLTIGDYFAKGSPLYLDSNWVLPEQTLVNGELGDPLEFGWTSSREETSERTIVVLEGRGPSGTLGHRTVTVLLKQGIAQRPPDFMVQTKYGLMNSSGLRLTSSPSGGQSWWLELTPEAAAIRGEEIADNADAVRRNDPPGVIALFEEVATPEGVKVYELVQLSS